MVAGTDDFTHLAQIALAIADASGLDDVCENLERGRLTRNATAAMRAAVAGGNAIVENYLRPLVETWNSIAPDLSGPAFALVLRTSVASVTAYRIGVPLTQVVWTGPRVEGSFLRATREVVREILRKSQREILLVGYWIAARDDGDGIIEEVIASLADAVRRSVKVSVIIDERVRADGRDNRRILLSIWPLDVTPPVILTWRLPADDQHLKLHAKVIVADRRDALVTSANLTSYAMDRNIEMGVRVVGYPAADIARHFDLLETQRVIEPYGDGPALP